jgi:hypothetical protein
MLGGIALSSLGAHKVLVQWLPSPTLRSDRFLEVGASRGTPVQQSAVKLILHPEEFPVAMALATQAQDGRLFLQVGFSAPVHAESGGWAFDEPPNEGQRAKWAYWNHEPTAAELTSHALNAWALSHTSPELEVLNARIAKLRSVGERLLAGHEESVQTYLRDKAPSPIFDVNAFFEVAAYYEPPVSEAPRKKRAPRRKAGKDARGAARNAGK